MVGLKRIAFASLILTLILASCQKQEFPQVTPPEALFKLEGSLDGEPWQHEVGLDGSFLETIAFEEIPGRDILLSELIRTDCQDCPSLGSFMLTSNGMDFSGQPLVNPETLLSEDADFMLGYPDETALYAANFEEFEDSEWQVFVNGEPSVSGWEELNDFGPGDEVQITLLSEVSGLTTWDMYFFPEFDATCDDEFRWIQTPDVLVEVGDPVSVLTVQMPEELAGYDYVEMHVGFPDSGETYVLFPNQEFEIELDSDVIFSGTIEFAFFHEDDPVESPLFMSLFTLAFFDEEITSPGFAIQAIHELEAPVMQMTLEVDDEHYFSHECGAEDLVQPEDSYFEILAVEDFEENQWGQPTRKVTFACDLRLFSAENPDEEPLHLVIDNGVLAFPLPD